MMYKHKQGGYIVILNTLLFISIMAVMLVALSNIVVIRYSSSQGYSSSKQSYLLAHSAAEEALYRLKNGLDIPASGSITLSSGSATINVTDTPNGKEITVNSDSGGYNHNIKIGLSLGTGISFHYGIQSGMGGFVLQNSSSVTGNIYSGGTVVGSGNYIYGDVISSGSGGLVHGIHATGTVYAHTIGSVSRATTIDKDAYYTTKVGTVSVGGTQYSGSDDQPAVDLPISDEQIALWEDEADNFISSGCSEGMYKITSDIPLGPIKIPCNLEISGSPTITIAGPVWVTGNITTKNSPTIKISSTLGNQNVAIIADNPANRSGSGVVEIANSTNFQNSGVAGSFVFMISQNNSAEMGGSVEAIQIDNSATALVVYAPHGLIAIANTAALKEATAYRITLKNSANVTYDKGLANAIFKAGPSGGYSLLNWSEI